MLRAPHVLCAAVRTAVHGLSRWGGGRAHAPRAGCCCLFVTPPARFPPRRVCACSLFRPPFRRHGCWAGGIRVFRGPGTEERRAATSHPYFLSTRKSQTHTRPLYLLFACRVAARRAEGAAAALITPWTWWRRRGCMVRAGGGGRGEGDQAYAHASPGFVDCLTVVVVVGGWVAAPRRACACLSAWETVTRPPP